MAVVASRAQGHKDSGAGDPTLVTDTGRAEAMIGRYYRAPISSAHDRHFGDSRQARRGERYGMVSDDQIAGS